MTQAEASDPLNVDNPDMPVFRFAPSPNGRLHLGHAYSALINRRLADETGGEIPAADRGHRYRPLHTGAGTAHAGGSGLAGN